MARDDDEAGLIALIGDVFTEYDGCVLDVDGEMPELRGIATWFAAHDGRFWVAESETGAVVGCVGIAPAATEPGGAELKKFYVAKDWRAIGVGRALWEHVLAAAREREARFMDLWSDTRFQTAHAWYERKGFVRGPTTRDLHDKSQSVEFYFRLDLGTVLTCCV